jgi:3-hydroxyacyl-CoA dehydrogenase/3a,7a,12a-trihydroxy-5b-cholest-24-enoyl-CoA hydratase/multifunctional beta-oxidation protein/peroxisomal enoyl-CoA hydratase 2
MSGKIEPEKVLAFKPEPSTSECLDRDAILYALGIGYSHDPLNNEELQYTYELHDEFKVFPTYCTCLHKNDLFKVLP